MIAWERRLFAALGHELSPTPGRVRATMRLTLACMLTIIIAIGLHLPEIHWLIVTIFVVSQADAQASFDKAVQRTLGTLMGGGMAIVMVALLSGKQELLLIAIACWVAFGLYLARTQADSYVFLLFGVTVLVAVPDQVADPARAIEMAILRILMLTIGSIIGAFTQLALWPENPERQLIEDMAERLGHAVVALDHTVVRRPFMPVVLRVKMLGPGMVRQLDLLNRAEALDDRLRQRHAEQLRLITEIDRLIAAIILLRREARDQALSDAEIAAVDDLARALRQMQAALARGAIYDRPMPALPADAAVRPVIAQLYRIAADLPGLTGFLDILTHRQPPRPPMGHLPRFRTAAKFDANAMRLAIKGGIALTLCGLAYQILLWPGITTCVVTAIIVMQPSRGASVRKAWLRSAGAILGALFGLLALALLGPSLNSLGPLVMVATIAIGASAYLNTGSTRISYAGMQMAMAFGLVALDGQAISGNLTPGIDRVLGILLGIAIATVVDAFLWPVSARAAAAAKLAAAQKGLDKLAAGPEDRAAETVAVHRNLAAAVAQFEDARWELSGRPADRTALAALGREIDQAQRRFLALTVHRPDSAPLDAVQARPLVGT